MQRRTTALTAAALSLLPLGQPLLSGTLGIAAATAAVVLNQGAAISQDASAVARIAKAITVRIEGATQGSGVIVKREGNRYTVLTAWHVVSGNRPGEEVGIYTSDGKEHQLEQGSIERLGQVDMAVLTFSSPGAYEVASIGDVRKVKHDQPIYVAGFPLSNSQNLRYESGAVVANAEVGIDQGYQLLYDNKTDIGMSGGALLNADGQLIGLHGRGEKDKQASNGELVMKTGVNQGVPITYYNLFASGAPVVVGTSKAATSDDYLAQAFPSLGKKGREQTVIRLVNQALSIRSSDDGYFYRAFAKADLGDNRGSIADLNKAIAINPQSVSAYNNRGHVKFEMGDNQGAIPDYNKAIAIDPQFKKAYLNRGLVKRNLGDNQGAISDYSEAIAIDPQYALAYYNRGTAKAYLGDYRGAIADHSQAIAINPQFAKAYNNRAYAKNNLGDKRGAIADYSKAIAINPQLAGAYNNRANVKADLGDYRGAISDYSEAIAINPQNSEFFFGLGNANYLLGYRRRAMADYSKAIAINPKSAKAYRSRGVVKSYFRDYRGAIADFSKAIAIDPRYATAYRSRGISYEYLRDLRRACMDWRAAASLGERDAAKWVANQCR